MRTQAQSADELCRELALTCVTLDALRVSWASHRVCRSPRSRELFMDLGRVVRTLDELRTFAALNSEQAAVLRRGRVVLGIGLGSIFGCPCESCVELWQWFSEEVRRGRE
jgi:hypothetical protein